MPDSEPEQQQRHPPQGSNQLQAEAQPSRGSSDRPQVLPVPARDGATDRLRARKLPDIALPATVGGTVRLARQDGLTLVFVYPRTMRPGEEPAGGAAAWNAIPGAYGCIAELCAVRDHLPLLREAGLRVFGLSAQTTMFQCEAAERLALNFPLLSDREGQLRTSLGLPVIETHGEPALRRLTLILENGVIRAVDYPVFPPEMAPVRALRLVRSLL